jgi:hypothetical protein
MRNLKTLCMLLLIQVFVQMYFFVWDGNPKLQTWLPYINHVHNDKPSWHIYVDSIVLDTSHKFVKLFTTMMDLNK